MSFKFSRAQLKEFRQIAGVLRNLPMVHANWYRMSKRVPAYRNKKLGLVIKRSNFILNPRTPLKVRVPSITLDQFDWVVQPYCERVKLDVAVQLIKKELSERHNSDLHPGNVGWYKKKPVMFDW